MRIFLGFLITALALGGALWLHDARLRHIPERYTISVAYDIKYGWQDPLAVFLAVAGIGAGVALVYPATRQT